MSQNNSNNNSHFVVVLRAGSKLRFSPDQSLQVDFKAGEDSVQLTFQTRYFEKGFESPLPRDLWIDARGTSASLQTAVTNFTNAALFFTNIISFTMNGFAGDCNYHVAYDNTPGKNHREFVERFIEDERGLPNISRTIKPSLILPFIEKLGNNIHRERISRAINQYTLALRYWRTGDELLATAHLFMGMETLVPVVRKLKLAQYELDSSQELADLWEIPLNKLDSTIRRKILFQEDLECHKDAKKASDGFEHGFLAYSEARPLAVKIRNQTALYLRHSIIELLNLPTEIKRELLGKTYINPIGTEGYIRFIRGTLNSNHDDLAPEGYEYPIINWEFGIKRFHLSEDGKFSISFKQKITPSLGKDVTFSPKSLEIYGPEGIVVESPSEKKLISDESGITSPDKKGSQIIRILREINDLIQNYQSNQYFEVTLPFSFILSIYSHCLSLFQGIYLLLKNQLAEEALILCHPLFANYLRLIQLSDGDLNKRNALALGWATQTLKAQVDLIHDVNKVRGENDVDELVSILQNREEKIKKIGKKIGLADFEEFLPTKKAAEELASEYYGTFLYSYQMFQGSDIANIFRRKEVEKGKFALNLRTNDSSLITEVGKFAAELILLSSKAISTIFKWPEMENLEELLAEVKSHAE